MKLDCQSIKLFINTDLSDTEKYNGRSCFYCLKFILGSHTATKLPVALHECLCYMQTLWKHKACIKQLKMKSISRNS